MTKFTEKNPRGAGRKPLPYRTKVLRVPVHLEEKVREFINQELSK